MALYEVINKHHERATMIEQQVIDARGNPFTVLHAGVAQRLEKGAVVDDLRPDELAAFPDRFQLVSGEPLRLPTPPPPVPRLNPELFALLRRAHAGEATADEQQVVGPLVAYLEHHAQCVTTPYETAAMEQQLADFGLPLFVEVTA